MSHHPQSQVPVNYYYGLGERCPEADKTNPDEPLLCLDRCKSLTHSLYSSIRHYVLLASCGWLMYVCVAMPNFKEKRDDAYSGLFITNCNAAVRRGYLKELGTHIPLHSYGILSCHYHSSVSLSHHHCYICVCAGSCLHTAGLSALQGQGAKRRVCTMSCCHNTSNDGMLCCVMVWCVCGSLE
jgi:hypothetical protein